MISDAVAVGDGEHRLEPAQDAVGAPVLGELDRRALQLALVLVELGLEALEQRERVGGRAREAGEHAVVVQAAHLARGRLDDDVAERHLAVAAERDAARRDEPKGWSCREKRSISDRSDRATRSAAPCVPTAPS